MGKGREQLRRPSGKTTGEGIVIQTGQDGAIGIMRGDAVFQGEIAAQPVQTCFAPCLDFRAVVRATEDGGNGDHEHFREVMADFAFLPCIRKGSEEFEQGYHGVLRLGWGFLIS